MNKAMKKTFNALMQAAQRGDIEAQYELGIGYADGVFSSNNTPEYKKATYWLNEASLKGHLDAMASLGVIYISLGQYQRAKKMLENAAQQGNVLAQSNLGIMYQKGVPGINKDDVKAKKWLKKAARQGEAEAQNNLAYYYSKEGNDIRAKELYEKSALQGYSQAKLNLGILYKNGINGVKDYKKSAQWFEQAANNGFAGIASFFMGKLYEEGGHGLQQDTLKACLYYVRAHRFSDNLPPSGLNERGEKTIFNAKKLSEIKLIKLDQKYLK